MTTKIVIYDSDAYEHGDEIGPDSPRAVIYSFEEYAFSANGKSEGLTTLAEINKTIEHIKIGLNAAGVENIRVEFLND